jgi:hypothetical protein
MEIYIPVGEIDTLSRMISVVAALAALAWAAMCVNLNVSRQAAMYFCWANVLVVLGDVAAQFRGPGAGLIDYYQAFNASYITILGSAFFFRQGMQELHGQGCNIGRDALIALLAFLLMFGRICYWAPKSCSFKRYVCEWLHIAACFFAKLPSTAQVLESKNCASALVALRRDGCCFHDALCG